MSTSTAVEGGAVVRRWEAATATGRGNPAARRRAAVWGWRVLVLVAMLALWQFVPSIPGVTELLPFADPFFISSPSQVAVKLWQVLVVGGRSGYIWGPFLQTMGSALLGTISAVIVGAVLGLILSHWSLLSDILQPFVTFFNAIPRVVMIPVIILIAGTSVTAVAVTAFTIVFFLAFYTAFESSTKIATEILQSARLLGTSEWGIIWRVRWPFVLGWTISSLPNSIAFGIIGAVTAELFTGASGIGRTLTNALYTSDATLTFAVVIVLAFAGVALVGLANLLRRRLLPWWEGSAEDVMSV